MEYFIKLWVEITLPPIPYIGLISFVYGTYLYFKLKSKNKPSKQLAVDEKQQVIKFWIWGINIFVFRLLLTYCRNLNFVLFVGFILGCVNVFLLVKHIKTRLKMIK